MTVVKTDTNSTRNYSHHDGTALPSYLISSTAPSTGTAPLMTSIKKMIVNDNHEDDKDDDNDEDDDDGDGDDGGGGSGGGDGDDGDDKRAVALTMTAPYSDRLPGLLVTAEQYTAARLAGSYTAAGFGQGIRSSLPSKARHCPSRTSAHPHRRAPGPYHARTAPHHNAAQRSARTRT